MNNKDLANEIARASKLPIDEARKLLFVILDETLKSIRKNKTISITNFGHFSLFKQKRVHLPSGEFKAPTKYKCRFIPHGDLKRLLRNKYWRGYCWTLAKKYIRLKKEGDKKGVIKTKKQLRKALGDNRRMAEWLDGRGWLPWSLDEWPSDAV